MSDTTSFLCPAFSSIMLHHMANSLWATLLHFFARQSHQSCYIPWPTACKWHCFICLQGILINHISLWHDDQRVSDTASFVCQVISSIMLHPMTNSLWVTWLHLFAWHSHQPCLIPWPTGCEWVSFVSRQWSHQSCCISWPTACEWHCFICLPGILINYVASHD